jgi:hypothetical protein
MSVFPFTQKRINESTIIRKFSKAVSSADLEWHRDRQDRVVEVINGNGWMIQMDDSLPLLMEVGDRIRIRANKWHRVIKGNDDLIVAIVEGKKAKGGQKKIAKLAPPEDEITGADFKALRSKNISEEDKPHPAQYDAAPGTKRDKDLDKCKELYKKAKKSGKKADMDKAVKCREKMEKKHMKESYSIILEAADDAVEEALLDKALLEVERVMNEGGKSSKGLSKSVKKSLDKKADKRCLTKGSVYAEFRAGLAAFLSSGSRKGMSAHQWAHARVNSAQPSKKWAKVKKRKKC